MVCLEAVYHRTFGSMAYYKNNSTVKLLIRTRKNDFSLVECEYYDKYDYKVPHSKITMTLSGQDKFFSYYTAEIVPPYKRLCYFFRLHCNKKEYVYKQFGFTNNIHDGDFQLPYINPCDVYNIPDWLKNGVFYQIFPDGFSNFGKKNVLPESYEGGTLKGIIKHLDYLKNLGITAIYLNPIFPSTTYHRYDVIDYFNIDPLLGTKQDFKQLVSSCHKAGIKVVLDAVFNHTSSNNPMFLDVLKNGEKSQFANFYVINSYKNGKPYNYDRFAFENYMPKLNTSNVEVQKFLIDVVFYWIKEFDIDGWRFDVGNEIGHNLINQIRNEVKKVKQQAYLLGEVWHDAPTFLLGNEYDGVTNFTLKDLLFKFFKNEIDVKQFVDDYYTYYFGIPNPAIMASSNFLCNHDTARAASEITDENVLKQMIAVQFVMLGTPLIFYGEEIGMKHCPTQKGDKGARKLMEWDKTKNNPLLDYYKKLIKLKTTNKCLSNENVKLEIENNMLVVIRENKNHQVKLIVNNSNKNKTIKLNKNYKNYLTNQTCLENQKIVVNSHDLIILAD